MANYVLKIMDGAEAGRELELPAGRSFRIGRRKGCDLVLESDEKASGNHCELVFEQDVLILRDLESTNGTRVDGKRIQEIPVSHGDRFQVGLTTIQVIDRSAGALPADDDMGLKINAELLERSSRRSPVALILLAAIVAVGGAGWWFFLRADAPRRKKGNKPVAAVPGNKLSEGLAHLEGDAAGWLPLAAGGTFTRSGGARTGTGALRCDLGGGDAESPGGVFAVAVPAQPVQARAGASYEARAHFRTQGRVRVALRILFFPEAPAKSPEDEADEENGTPRFTRVPAMVAGSALSELPGDDYRQVSARVAVPNDAREVALALVAVLANGAAGEARAWVDDVSLVEVAGDAASTRQVRSRGVFVPDDAAGSLRIDDGRVDPLRAISVLPEAGTDPPLEALAEHMPLPAVDLHGRLQIDYQDRGLSLAGSGGGRIVLHVPDAVLDGGSYKVRQQDTTGAARFDTFAGHHSFEGVTGLYWGYGGDMLHRVLAVPPGPAALVVEGDTASASTRFVLGFPGALTLQLVLDDEQLATMRLLSDADAAYDGNDLGKALARYTKILRESPFETRAVQRATLRRSEMLTEARRKFEALRRDFDEAKAFHYEGLYRDILDRLQSLDELEAELGPDVDAFRQQVTTRLNEVEKAKGEVRGARLVEVARALFESEQKRLAHLISRFIAERFPDAEPAKTARSILAGKLPEAEERGDTPDRDPGKE